MVYQKVSFWKSYTPLEELVPSVIMLSYFSSIRSQRMHPVTGKPISTPGTYESSKELTFITAAQSHIDIIKEIWKLYFGFLISKSLVALIYTFAFC